MCEENISAYLYKVEEFLGYFTKYKLEKIPREQNENIDALTKLVSIIDSDLRWSISVKLLNEPNTNISKQILAIQSRNS